VPRALETAILGNVSFAERGEQVAAAVGDRERLTCTDADRERAVRGLDDGDLSLAEIVDADKASGSDG
jgi:hypothetical protein